MTSYEKRSPSPRTRNNFEIDEIYNDPQAIKGLTRLLGNAPTSGIRGTTTLRLSISISTPQLLELLSKAPTH